jgi:hypothetical protein
LDLLISFYSPFAGAFVSITQTNKAKRKALEVTFREHCLGAGTGLISNDISELVNGRGVRTSVKNQEPALNRGLPGESRR